MQTTWSLFWMIVVFAVGCCPSGEDPRALKEAEALLPGISSDTVEIISAEIDDGRDIKCVYALLKPSSGFAGALVNVGFSSVSCSRASGYYHFGSPHTFHQSWPDPESQEGTCFCKDAFPEDPARNRLTLIFIPDSDYPTTLFNLPSIDNCAFLRKELEFLSSSKTSAGLIEDENGTEN